MNHTRFNRLTDENLSSLSGSGFPPVKEEGATHLFLPINDNPDVNQMSGGTHWSLLVVSILDQLALHYDSSYPCNHEEAKTATSKLSKMLDIPLRLMDLDDTPQ